jgi:colanic acid biosynthesis glycosyl transferase WcaI
MLASGRPVVAQTDGGELARAARAGGVAVAPDDPASMARAILALGADDERRRRLGRAARRFAETHLDREPIIQRYVSRMAAQVSAGSALRAWWPRLRDPVAARLPGAPTVTYATPPEAGRRR